MNTEFWDYQKTEGSPKYDAIEAWSRLRRFEAGISWYSSLGFDVDEYERIAGLNKKILEPEKIVRIHREPDHEVPPALPEGAPTEPVPAVA